MVLWWGSYCIINLANTSQERMNSCCLKRDFFSKIGISKFFINLCLTYALSAQHLRQQEEKKEKEEK